MIIANNVALEHTQMEQLLVCKLQLVLMLLTPEQVHIRLAGLEHIKMKQVKQVAKHVLVVNIKMKQARQVAKHAK